VGKVRRSSDWGGSSPILSSAADICRSAQNRAELIFSGPEALSWLDDRGHLDIGKSGIRNPESGFCFFAGICLYWISLVFYSFLSLVQGIFHVELFFFLFSGIKQLLITYKVHNFQSLACISTLLFENSELNFKKEIY
jgi:cytochrome b subunit of formate dehydrogenase